MMGVACCTDDDGAFKEARSAHKVAAAAQEAESVACILESVYAEVAKGDTDLAEVSPMCLSTNPLCGQEDSPLVQAELKPQPQQVHARSHHHDTNQSSLIAEFCPALFAAAEAHNRYHDTSQLSFTLEFCHASFWRPLWPPALCRAPVKD